MATVTSRLPNSTQRWISGSPDAPPATRLREVQSGQVVQPSPDWLRRTAAPVSTMAAEASSPASAIRRITAGDGHSSSPISRRGVHHPAAPAAGRAAAGGVARSPVTYTS